MLLLGSIAVVLSFLMILLIRYFACVLIWTMYVLSGAGAIAAMSYCWYRYTELKKLLDAIPEPEQMEEDKELVMDWRKYAIVATVMTSILLLLLLVIRSRLALVIQLFHEAGQAIGKMPLILIQPLWTILFLLMALVSIGYGALYVFTAAHPVINEDTGFVEHDTDKTIMVSIHHCRMAW